MHKLILSVIISFFFAQVAFAHDILKTLSKDQLIEVQMMLVEKGYLKMPEGTQFGTYGPLTETAFDKYQADRDRETYAEKKQTSATTTEKLSFFSWIRATIRSWF